MKKIVTIALSALLLLSLTACGGEKKADTLTVGVIQYAPHPSLDNCYEGFVEGLAEAGYVVGENLEIKFENAMGEPSTADTIAKNLTASKVDLICAIATPSAMSAYSATRQSSIPVVFSAVSDPVAAGLVASLDAPGSNATGTSDQLNFDAQLQLIRAFLPEATTIGVLYTTSESNSISHLAEFEALAPHYGFTVEAIGITDAASVGAGAQALVAKGVDCINNFTDNNVVNQLSQLLKAANDANIPVFGSEVEQVVNGCLASESLDYVALGNATGQIAAEILGGAKAAETAVQVSMDTSPVYNSEVAAALGIDLPSIVMEDVAE